jgi:hypothetical protein
MRLVKQWSIVLVLIATAEDLLATNAKDVLKITLQDTRVQVVE